MNDADRFFFLTAKKCHTLKQSSSLHLKQKCVDLSLGPVALQMRGGRSQHSAIVLKKSTPLTDSARMLILFLYAHCVCACVYLDIIPASSLFLSFSVKDQNLPQVLPIPRPNLEVLHMVSLLHFYRRSRSDLHGEQKNKTVIEKNNLFTKKGKILPHPKKTILKKIKDLTFIQKTEVKTKEKGRILLS